MGVCCRVINKNRNVVSLITFTMTLSTLYRSLDWCAQTCRRSSDQTAKVNTLQSLLTPYPTLYLRRIISMDTLGTRLRW